REDKIHADNAARLQTRLVAEGANGPTSLEADAILAERGIPVLPDVLTNAGGVTVSYFEWVQDLGRLFWDRREIRAKLADQLGDAFDRVWTLPGDLPVSPDRVRDAMIPEPRALDASVAAQEAGSHLTQPDVRAVYVSDSDRFVGVVTRKTLVEKVVAAGRDPREVRVGEIAEQPNWTLDPDLPLDEAFALL